jgi:hypothetical protein
LVRFASIAFEVRLSSFLPCLGRILFRFDLARIETRMVCFRLNPARTELRFLFDLVCIKANYVRFASILPSSGVTHYVLVRSCPDFC